MRAFRLIVVSGISILLLLAIWRSRISPSSTTDGANAPLENAPLVQHRDSVDRTTSIARREPLLPATIELTGRVVDTNDNAIGHATVALEDYDVETSSDSRGEFLVSIHRARIGTQERVLLRARKGTMIGEIHITGSETQGITIRMSPGHSYAFRIVDGSLGTPIGNAWVTSAAVDARSSRTGEVYIDGLPAVVRIRFEADGYEGTTRVLSRDREDATVHVVSLHRGVKSHGLVLDLNNQPVEHAKVEVINTQVNEVSDLEFSDARGLWTTVLAGGPHQFLIDGKPHVLTKDVINGKELLVARVSKPRIVYGLVRDLNGSPLEGAEIYADGKRTLTDDRGRFEVIGVPHDGTLWARLGERASALASGANTEIEFVLVRTLVRCHVTDSSSSGETRYALSIGSREGVSKGGVFAVPTAEFEALPLGRYRVVAISYDGERVASEEIELTMSTPERELRLVMKVPL